jgi:hypothetical protein
MHDSRDFLSRLYSQQAIVKDIAIPDPIKAKLSWPFCGDSNEKAARRLMTDHDRQLTAI